nr:MAG TPA: Terminase small subunit [Caudoviricetes sp.]
MAKQVYRFVNSKQKNRFLNTYIAEGTIGSAAEACGITRQTHYNWLKEDPEYKKGFAQAKEMAGDLLEEEARRRAVEGDECGIYYKGELVGSYRKKSDALLILLLKGAKPDVYADRQETKISGEITVNAAQALKEARERIKNAADNAAEHD